MGRRKASVGGAARGAKGSRSKATRTRGLLLVGLFKLSKAVFFAAVGAGALHLVDKNVSVVVARAIDVLRIDPERRMVGILIEKAGLISNHELRRAGVLSILYAAVCVVEGTGLVLEKRWAEYLTVTLTGLGLPWEIYELAKSYSAYKMALLAVNLAVLLYLVWVLERKKEAT